MVLVSRSFKVKVFAWTAVLDRVNTNDPLQSRRPNDALSPKVYLVNYKADESQSPCFA